MSRWVLVVIGLGAAAFLCCGSLVLVGLAADDGAASPRASGACAGTIDGWQQTITDHGLVFARGQYIAEMPWPFPFTDELRQNDPEMNVWNAALGGRFTPGQLRHGGSGDQGLWGTATDRSSGRTVYIAFTTGASGGIANPIAVIGPDDSVLTTFPSSGALNALSGLNRFPLSCTAVEGRWKSGFNSVSERYAASTGRFLGLATAAAWRDLKLEDGSYARESNAFLNGMYSKRTDSGRWSHDDWSLTLEPEGAEALRYNAAYVAVQNGFLLRLNNQKFSGDTEEFQRAE